MGILTDLSFYFTKNQEPVKMSIPSTDKLLTSLNKAPRFPCVVCGMPVKAAVPPARCYHHQPKAGWMYVTTQEFTLINDARDMMAYGYLGLEDAEREDEEREVMAQLRRHIDAVIGLGAERDARARWMLAREIGAIRNAEIKSETESESESESDGGHSESSSQITMDARVKFHVKAAMNKILNDLESMEIESVASSIPVLEEVEEQEESKEVEF